jgi:hypothetical protein
MSPNQAALSITLKMQAWKEEGKSQDFVGISINSVQGATV